MKKTWNAPQIDTLDVTQTLNGATYWPREGTLVFKPDEGEDEEIIEVGPTPS